MGGVVNFIDSITQNRSPNSVAVERFLIGKRPGGKAHIYYLLTLFYDSLRLFFKLFKDDYKVMHLNPSLGAAAMIRDGIFLVIAKLHCRKVLVFWHGWDQDTQSRIERNRFARHIFRQIFDMADASVVLASPFKKKLRQWGFRQKIFLDTTAVDEGLLNNFSPEQKIQEIKGTGKLTLLFLARLEKTKGIVETIEAFLAIKGVERELELIIAGDGPDAELVQKRVQEANDERITVTGYVRGDQKKAILKKSHLLIFPSYYGEGLPVCILEAMAFGMPIVTTPVGGIPDNFTEGKNGYYVRPVTATALACLLGKMITDKEKLAAMAATNYAHARHTFPASIVAGRLDGIYRQLLSR